MEPNCDIDADGFCATHGNDCDDYRLYLRQEAETETQPDDEDPSFVEVVNWYATRRHLATPNAQVSTRQIKTLCPNTFGLTFEAHAKQRKGWTDKTVDYEALPMCRNCTKAAGMNPGSAPTQKTPTRIFRVESMTQTSTPGWKWWGTFSSVENAQAAVADAQWGPGVHRIVNRLTGEVVVEPFDD